MDHDGNEVSRIGLKELIGQVVLLVIFLSFLLTPYISFISSKGGGFGFKTQAATEVLAIIIVGGLTTLPILTLMFALHLNKFQLLNTYFVRVIFLFMVLAPVIGNSLLNLPINHIWTTALGGSTLLIVCIHETLQRLTTTR